MYYSTKCLLANWKIVYLFFFFQLICWNTCWRWPSVFYDNIRLQQGSVLRIWGGLSLLQYYMGGKGRGELLKTLIWSIQLEHDDDDDQYWVNIKVWEAVQISGISRTESEKHEKLAVGSTCRCSSMLWSTFWSELYQKDFFIITYGGNLSPDRFPP